MFVRCDSASRAMHSSRFEISAWGFQRGSGGDLGGKSGNFGCSRTFSSKRVVMSEGSWELTL